MRPAHKCNALLLLVVMVGVNYTICQAQLLSVHPFQFLSTYKAS